MIPRWWRSAGWSVIAVAVAGCTGRQSVLDPAGPQAHSLAQLAWLLFAFGTLVLLIVVAAAAIAIFGPTRWRAALASRRTVIGTGIFLPAVSLTGLLGYGLWLTRASVADVIDATTLQIEVTGERWWWRVRYALPAGATVESANEIRIPVGRPVRFTLRSADVIHSFWVPRLAGKVDMIPGRTTFLRAHADRAGVFRGQCAEYCGGPHALMALNVVAMAPTDFEQWLRSESQPGREPDSQQARRGAALFVEAGCGACHTVRGTPAGGTIGPDLTHLATRQSVGIESMAMNARNVAAFITDGQHIKPGNRMPPFRIFSDAELQALSVYLAGLR